MFKNFIDKLIDIFLVLEEFLLPASFFLILTYLPKILWNIGFNDYLEFLKILIWPCTALVILFFFRRVFTFLFFSMNKFSFFGAKGDLKNVDDVILEEVNKRFLEKEGEEIRKKDMGRLADEIKIKELELGMTKGAAADYSKLANEIMTEWKKSTAQTQKTILELDAENRRLKEIILGSSSIFPETSFAIDVNDNKTSDPVLEESNIEK